MKLKKVLAGSAVVVGVVGSVSTVFAATQSHSNRTSSPAPTSKSQLDHNMRSSNMEFKGQDLQHMGPKLNLAKILGIKQATLKSDFQSGESLLQIAKKQGMTETTLIARLKSALKSNLNTEVKAGKITSSQESKMLSDFSSHAKQFVEHAAMFGQGHHGAWKHDMGPKLNLAKILGIKQATLKSDFQSGESLLQIAKKQGMTETTLIATLKSAFKSNLNTEVKAGKITSSQETKMLSNFSSHAKQFVGHAGMFRQGHHEWHKKGFSSTGSTMSTGTKA